MAKVIILNGALAGGHIYYPTAGETTAHLTGSIYDNSGRGEPRVYPFIVWNGREAAPGKGLADQFAKFPKGKMLSIIGEMETYQGKVFHNGQIVVDPATGQQIKMPKSRIRIVEFQLHSDSKSQIRNEIEAWNQFVASNPGQPIPFSFNMRPPQWDIEGSQDAQIWTQIRQWRQAQVYQGGDTYGYAKVNSAGPGTLLPRGNAAAGTGIVSPGATTVAAPGATVTPSATAAPGTTTVPSATYVVPGAGNAATVQPAQPMPTQPAQPSAPATGVVPSTMPAGFGM